DAAAQEAAGESRRGKEPDTEDSRSGQREDRQGGQRCVWCFRTGNRQRPAERRAGQRDGDGLGAVAEETATVERNPAGESSDRTQGSIFQRKHDRWKKRMGPRKALIAICHALLIVAYEVLKQDRPYVEPDPNQLEEQERSRRIRHHANALRKLGADETMIQDLV